jgi:hypothetical protein
MFEHLTILKSQFQYRKTATFAKLTLCCGEKTSTDFADDTDLFLHGKRAGVTWE